MFRNVPVFDHVEDNLAALARTMVAPADSRDIEPEAMPAALDKRENALIPAGYTYLGQFIAHDITFDPVSSLQKQSDPDGLHDFRTPRFDLDSVYGGGPADQPFLYRNGPGSDPHPLLGFDQRGVVFLLGDNRGDGDKMAKSSIVDADLPRNSQGRAVIADPRNDENLIISQLHVMFLKFHNRMVEFVFEKTGLTGDDLFHAAQRLVRWHYQWVVIRDFLPRIVDGKLGPAARSDEAVVNDILKDATYVTSRGIIKFPRISLQFYHWHKEPFIPIEFSVAAYRFGHSMVRPSYFINDFVRHQNNNTRIPIFSADNDPLANLTGFRPLPEKWGFQWKYFFDILPDFAPQRSYKIDTLLSTPLGSLPEHPDMASLAQRNLVRALRLGLPSGQTVARAMGIQPLSDCDLGLSDRGAPDFDGDSPLWFYILREAELLSEGQHLGPVGGRIVAEVLIGLLVGDPLSWLNIEPNWQPPLMHNGEFGMPELLRFAAKDETPILDRHEGESPRLDRWRATFDTTGLSITLGSLWS